MRKRKCIIVWFMICLLLVACGAKKSDETALQKNGISEGAAEVADSIEGESLAESDKGATLDKADSKAKEESVSSDYALKGSVTDDFAAPEGKMQTGGREGGKEVKAGTLTAGEWNDNENWGFYCNLFRAKSEWKSYQESWGMNVTKKIAVTVKDADNDKEIVKDALVKLLDEKENVLWESVSDYKGMAYLFYKTGKDEKLPKKISVEKNGKVVFKDLDTATHMSGGQDGKSEKEEEKESKIPDCEISIVQEGHSEKKALDLMFVLDTTGSMGDELFYLQTELKDIVDTIKDKNEGMSLRVSMNFYRDLEDEYVVRSNEFTSDIAKAQKQLNAECADGGGDYEEAVEKALEDAICKHNWQADTTKVLFLILDAPPHNGKQINDTLQKAIKEAAKQGIRIIPVASSGVDKDTEFLLRTMAISTGGTYTFLTDDSGVGESHLEPTVGSYEVEKLNDMMVRLLNQYLQ